MLLFMYFRLCYVHVFQIHFSFSARKSNFSTTLYEFSELNTQDEIRKRTWCEKMVDQLSF